jgi:hypothetical protein
VCVSDLLFLGEYGIPRHPLFFSSASAAQTTKPHQPKVVLPAPASFKPRVVSGNRFVWTDFVNSTRGMSKAARLERTAIQGGGFQQQANGAITWELM